MPIQCVHDILVFGDGGEELLVDGLAGVGLLNHTENAVVKMLVELLGIRKGDTASGASTSHALNGAGGSLRRRGRLLAAIGWGLLHAVYGGKMSLEHIRTVEALLRGRARARTETANHRSLVMRQSMTVLVVFACEALEVVFAGDDGALFGALRLVSEHVRLQVLEDAATLWNRAETLLHCLLVELEATTASTAVGMPRLDG